MRIPGKITREVQIKKWYLNVEISMDNNNENQIVDKIFAKLDEIYKIAKEIEEVLKN